MDLLKFLNTSSEDYNVVFTRCATGALHTVGDIIQWNSKSYFIYLRQNHNSVLGIRNLVLKSGGKFVVVDEENVFDVISRSEERV